VVLSDTISYLYSMIKHAYCKIFSYSHNSMLNDHSDAAVHNQAYVDPAFLHSVTQKKWHPEIWHTLCGTACIQIKGCFHVWPSINTQCGKTETIMRVGLLCNFSVFKHQTIEQTVDMFAFNMWHVNKIYMLPQYIYIINHFFGHPLCCTSCNYLINNTIFRKM